MRTLVSPVQMEMIVDRMQHERTGVPVRTVKSFLTKIPSVFAGADLIAWMMKALDVEDQGKGNNLSNHVLFGLQLTGELLLRFSPFQSVCD